ncbi:hypothetical protein DBV05_g9872 [Lasiodiplodia theobromae]|uniref:Uncharacterized protein n=1 Tax=Lasiodiplodia theobromae TaxID=45133 RepID=A0A5N5D278_9PEZI|nr:hypothetical protein DBV05_g9872 [Lasiodiplodia theobromae]
MGTDSDPPCNAACNTTGPYRHPAASNSRTGLHCEYVISKLNATSSDNSILQAQLEELKEIFREKVDHLEEEIAHLTYKNQQMNHAAKNLQTYMSKQPIFFSDQLPDEHILGKTFLLLKRIKDWSALFSGHETASQAAIQDEDLDQYRAVFPGTTDLESLHAQLRDGKRRRLFVRGWTAYIICNTVFPASRDGVPSVPKSEDSMPANEAYQEKVLELENMMRSMDIPMAKVNDWRALTFHLSPTSESDDMGNIESTWMQKACARVLTVIKPWSRPEDMLMAVEELLSIFQDAVNISAVLQRQRACWTVRFPGVPQTDAAYVLPFDSTYMMAKDAEGPQGSRTVEGVITPAVFKRGNADGEAFDVETCAQEAVVVTSEECKEEVRHSKFIEIDTSL